MAGVSAAGAQSNQVTKPVAKKKVLNQFFFKEYEVRKGEKKKFDSINLWHQARVVKTLKLPGYINLNRTANKNNWNVQIKLKQAAGEEVKYYVLHSDWERTWEMINGNRLFYVSDPDGDYMALYRYTEGNWIIYRKNPVREREVAGN